MSPPGRPKGEEPRATREGAATFQGRQGSKTDWGTHARLLGMAVLLGASWPAGRALALNMPPLTSSAWRFALASTVLVIWLLATRGWPTLTRRQWLSLALGGAIGVFGYGVCFMLALQRVEASRAAMVVTINPVFTTVLAAWLFGERFNARIAAGLALATVGATLVLSQGDPARLLSGELGVGEWLLLGCIASWVAYTLIGRAMMRGIDSLAATTVGSLVGTLLLWVAALWIEGPALMVHTAQTTSPGIWTLMVVLALGSTVLAYVWYNRGIAVLGAGTAASYIALVPVFGVAMSAWVLGERLDAALWLGGAMALAGLAINNTGRRS